MDTWRKQKKDVHLVVLFSILSIVLYFIPSGFEGSADEQSHLAKAKIISVNNSSLRQSLIIKTGSQNITVEILSGEYKDNRVQITNSLTGKMELDEIYTEGEKILIEFNVVDGKPFWGAARGKYRINLELLLLAMFAV
ncbi:MAG: hypothetical protein JXA96_10385, partial [Sedimentisphaerales bacterium]|nr:hypothetical protein [Sedimentisphaerales bacterium]